MSTIKSSAENLTLNADGANNDIIFQSNGSNVATLDQAGLLTATTFAGSGASLTGLFNPDGAVTINDSGADVDFRVESDTDANMLFVDGGANRVGIGTGTPSQPFELRKDQNSDTTAQIWNDTAGTGAAAALRLKTNSSLGIIAVQDDGYTSSGIYQAATLSIFAASTATGGVLLGTEGAHPIKFYVGNTEAFRIKSDRVTEWGTYSSSGASYGVRVQSSSQEHTMYYSGAITGNNDIWRFYNPNALVGKIQMNGSSTAYYTSSDYRLKENVSYTWDATTRLKQLKPARFNFIADDTTTLDGFLAHEVSSIVPQAITGDKDAMEIETRYTAEDVETQGDNPTKEIGDVKTYSATRIDPQNIDHSKLVPLLVKTIQEMEARITALEA